MSRFTKLPSGLIVPKKGLSRRAFLGLGAAIIVPKPSQADMMINSYVFGKSSLISILQNLNLTTNLKVCLDAGDIDSAPASATSWLDTSGNGYDFNRGTTSGAEASDPTFNGTPGNRSINEYWSFDGADVFTYDTTNEAWMQNIHKDNAIFTIFMWVNLATTSVTRGLIGTRGALTGNTGLSIHFNPNDSLSTSIANAGASPLARTSAIPAPSYVESAWFFVATSIDEGAATGLSVFNASTETWSSTYTSPAAGNASFTMQLGSRGNSDSPLNSGCRMGMVGIYEGTALSAAELESIRQETKGRWGL